MPLTRYQVRSEFSLADPELYRAADRDDPEALLEGVAMAGLVGVLRQLGDLAEFAAEIFHDLHEEVMATAARGHGLMARVQQLEAEVPSIEKEFLSQTSHSLFFSNAGVDWHPNLRMEQNLITRGDLPRFVMDSYEECRGPPRLFLLDKFDVAGAGACLKRYTDPSFFKVEAASSGKATEVQREKKNRKVKKKGSRWRNGEAPDVQSTSHAKLHQLFLEERIENTFSDPARLVKLKKRQLNGYPFDSKSGRSYMEKFVETDTAEHEVVHEKSITSPVKLTMDNYSESGLEILEISTVSPVKKSSQGKESACSSPNAQEEVSEPYMEKFNSDVIGGKFVQVSEPGNDGDINDISSSSLDKVAVEKELAVDGDLRTEGSVDGYNSDDLASEIDKYMDALNTIESEIETENEYRPENDQGFFSVKKDGRDSDENEENLALQAQFSDSQSFGNSSVSDYGNGSFKNNRSSFSDSDTLSSLAEHTASGGDGVAKVFPSSETCAAESVDIPSSQLMDELEGTKSHDFSVPNGTRIEEDKIPDVGEASCSSCLTDSIPVLLPSDHGVHLSLDTLVGPEVEEVTSDSIKIGSKLSDNENGTNLVDSSAVVSGVPSQDIHDICLVSSVESHLDVEEPNVVSDALLHSSDVSKPTLEIERSNFSLNEALQAESVDEEYSENLADEKIASPHSSSPKENQLHCSASPQEVCSDLIPPTCSSDLIELDDIVSKADDALMVSGINSAPMVETQKTHNFEEQEFLDLMDDVPELKLASAEFVVPYSDKKSDIDGSREDGEEIGTPTCSVEVVEDDVVPLELPSDDPNYLCHKDDVNLDAVVNKPVITDEPVSAAAVTGADGDLDDVIKPVTTDESVSAAAITSADGDLDDVIKPVITDESVSAAAVTSADGDLDDVTKLVITDESVSAAAVTGADGDLDDVIIPVITDESVSAAAVTGADGDLDDVTKLVITDESVSAAAVTGADGDLDDVIIPVITDESVSAAAVTIADGDLDDVTKLVITDESVSAAAVSSADGVLDDVIPTSPDLTCSPSGNHINLEESLSGFSDSNQKGLEFNEAASPECLTETMTQKEVNQLEVAPGDTTLKLLSSDHCNLRMFDDIHESSLGKETQNSLSDNDVTRAPTYLVLSNEQSESKSPPQSYLFENNEGEVSSLTCYPPEPGVPLEKPLQFKADQAEVESLQEDEATSNSLKLQSEQLPSPSHIDQERCEQTQSSNHLQERCFDTPSESCAEHLPCQLSASEFLPQSASLEPDGTKQAMDSLQYALPSFGLLPVAAQVNLEEMPPLPPLPPMQWRMGKAQNASLASDRDLVEASQHVFPPLQPFNYEKAQFGFPASKTGNLQLPNPFLPITAVEDENSQQVSEQVEGNLAQPIPFSFQLPTMDSEADSQHNCLSLEGTQTLNPFLTSPAIPNERPEYGFLALEGEKALSSSNSFSPIPTIEYATPKHESESSQEKQIKPLNQLEPEIGSEDKTLQPSLQNYSEGVRQNPFETSIPPPTIGAEQPQQALLTSDGEITQVPGTEEGKPNGNPAIKIPRPRSPLIDAVAAHDKSKLRKVAERVRPQIEPKVDERDSLLEQIRTKSFNLKPAVPTRPSIHGPKTNLKVAAILEKAKTIRQAFAGSDEDDSDGWSDC
ncbi:protein SCAR2 [Quercus lobata]|uniref:Protein SCAR n=1 Tax=Quercus lobata TaxID=97700 RepID=A0A7N2M6B1_QUELO|nr:protein SCAR2 [Quercus lobata]